MFSGLLHSWRESLVLLQPKNLKLFLLVTLKSLTMALRSWLIYAAPTLVVWALLSNMIVRFSYNTADMIIFVSYGWTAALTVSMILFMRPSVALKNCAYFRSYAGRAFLLVTIGLLLYLVPRNVSVIAWLCYVNFSLFALDSDFYPMSLIKSGIRGLRMIIYNFPVYVAFIVPAYLLESIVQTQYGFIIRMLSLLIWTALFVNLYVKRVHDQFTLYFGKNDQ